MPKGKKTSNGDFMLHGSMTRFFASAAAKVNLSKIEELDIDAKSHGSVGATHLRRSKVTINGQEPGREQARTWSKRTVRKV